MPRSVALSNRTSTLARGPIFMANAAAQPRTDHMQALFGAGTCTGLTDGQLLERFLAGRDEGGELAFEALVAQHGPMVMRVCRNVLDDPHDVHDAVQAVFLVLARRANGIRDRESVASWLYGVAVRVSARARVVAIKRQIRDRRINEAAQNIATADPDPGKPSPVERNDEAAFVHEELSRLPEKYRAGRALLPGGPDSRRGGRSPLLAGGNRP